MKVKGILMVVISMLIMANIFGCSQNETQGKADIRGEITKISINENDEITGILVEGNLESDTSYDKAMVYLSKKTKVYKGQGSEKARLSDLKEELQVEVEFTGAVAESYPVQAQAKVVRILD